MSVRRTLLLLLVCMFLLPVVAFALQTRRSSRTGTQSSQANQVYIVRRGTVRASALSGIVASGSEIVSSTVPGVTANYSQLLNW